jgi:hypothetical protein
METIEMNIPTSFPQIKAQGVVEAFPNQYIDGMMLPYKGDFGELWADLEMPDMSEVSLEQVQALVMNTNAAAAVKSRLYIYSKYNDEGWQYVALT